MVHVDDGEVRLPLTQDGFGLGEVAGRAHGEHAMVERQLDEVDDQRPVVQHERAPHFGLRDARLVHGAGALGFDVCPTRFYCTAIGRSRLGG
ncbi:MAG TPA: hypothetical protein VF763_01630 [Candidatus Limnocylindrales bacterium]